MNRSHRKGLSMIDLPMSADGIELCNRVFSQASSEAEPPSEQSVLLSCQARSLELFLADQRRIHDRVMIHSDSG
ncbi:unnamed protein product [Linum trigynum]|uniref:Uncharacterized protein n=1 Tax=Linum trigynum TaxID=586398 RepID=A0AAV2F1D6_9ROSI